MEHQVCRKSGKVETKPWSTDILWKHLPFYTIIVITRSSVMHLTLRAYRDTSFNYLFLALKMGQMNGSLNLSTNRHIESHKHLKSCWKWQGNEILRQEMSYKVIREQDMKSETSFWERLSSSIFHSSCKKSALTFDHCHSQLTIIIGA